MSASSLLHHMEISHCRILPQVRGVDVGGRVLEVYKVLFPLILKLVECAEERGPAKGKNPGRLREQFMFCYWKSKVGILQEGT